MNHTASKSHLRYSNRLASLAAWYVPRYVRRYFHAVRCDRDGLPPPIQRPTVIFTNHSSWWDPAIGALVAARHYARYRHFAPIDAEALSRYPVMKKLGFFPVDRNARRGAAQFIAACEYIFSLNDAILWLTPEGRFRDVRCRPVAMKRGIGHLPEMKPDLVFIPMAVEYSFGEERTAEAAIRFGSPIAVGSEPPRTPTEWTEFFARRLESEMDRLAEKVMPRRWDEFALLECGATGVGGIYDLIRRTGAIIRGRPFVASHGGRQN
jgi:1-acyl-sn-glycerol-3-phosphate acyltransferase